MTDLYLASAIHPGSFTALTSAPTKLGVPVNLLCVAWIDDNQLTRECFANAAGAMQSLLVIVPFGSSSEFLADPPPTADLVVYHHRGSDTAALLLLAKASVEAGATSPLVILADDISDDLRKVVDKFPQASTTLLHTKRTSLQMVVASLFLIHHGREVIPPAVSLPPVPLPGETPTAAPLSQTGIAPMGGGNDSGPLTKRERSVLELVRQGYANKNIAEDLQMSVSTVKAHIRNIMQKKRASNRTQLALGAERQLRSTAVAQDD
ncbi:helix-turn-helix transcriptional regulator [Acidisoma silvae]|uniref:Response regulator transcription factor n=1 Tax=Acidisoma silvae TaxID=2802396 RepID=A0A964DYT4_9PROT|nr:response regulator transcription factor [Acidisoma silvae]MCB8875730.1 response regulator transcription factor [Acidisoma silvae]